MESVVGRLNDMQDRPWPEMKNGKPLTATQFTRMVKPYMAKREPWRGARQGLPPGCGASLLAPFADAFTRYLPDSAAETGDTGVTVEALSVPARSEVVTPGLTLLAKSLAG